ncbi:UL73 viral envelope glycoprotein [Eptesicus fuscus gammaherpesvirus]|uniref:UL73 viral envelope glycoprotein n=1 Tax=vespertilionid gammaherpesvirus 3 TaxID=2846598 RepID=A0A2D0ZMJ6_9GAMA|nr:UL73 viral envelope glycoprotein [Eptesicus fuscus gammaherpesvirus]ATA58283.1 UL73 viral envelope glycoprotein [Eptesicus fuscus gammaherpesvirus]WAH70929.1 glycoprotein N [Eptesicus fuscus gammaherpesvirus]
MAANRLASDHRNSERTKGNSSKRVAKMALRLPYILLGMQLMLMLVACNSTSPTTVARPVAPLGAPAKATPKGAFENFYDYSCTADTYEMSFSSFSSVWAFLNVAIILIATVLFLVYMCFNKFVDTVVHS